MANHTKAVVTTDVQQKLLWDTIVDDGDNVGVDAWIQTQVDEKIDARIMSIDSTTRAVNLSIKALQMAEEKQAMKDYGSVDSGASLGDILGAALEKKAKKVEEKPKAKKVTKDKPKKTKDKEKKPEPK